MRAASCFYSNNSILLQGSTANQKFGIFLGIDIVGNHGNLKTLAHFFTEPVKQCGFAGTDRPANAAGGWYSAVL
jgi:hypothetical protein